MKAERRHELKTNTLAYHLERLPFTLREHGGKVLGAVLVVLLLILLLQYRAKTTRESKQAAGAALSDARTAIQELRNVQAWRLPPAELAGSVRESLDSLAGMSDDAQIQAEALVARGDLNWTLANLPDLPMASTQPTLQVPESKEELLEAAADAYQQVLQNHSDQTMAVVSAHFGLAAIAEDRGQWDKAAEHYQAIQSLPQAPKAFADLARLRVEGMEDPYQGTLPGLEDIRRPILVAQPATLPTTQEVEAAGLQPTTLPATAPTTAPLQGALPATAPAATLPTALPATTQAAP